jgi:hypothetical protein
VTNVYFFNVQLDVDQTGLEMDHVRNVDFDPNSSIGFFGTAATNDIFGSTSGFPDPYDATTNVALYYAGIVGSVIIPTGTTASLYDPDSQQWVLEGDGGGFTGTSDEFTSAFGTITGNYTIQAELNSLTPAGSGVAQAGLMFRNSTSRTDPFAAIFQTSSNQIVFEYRLGVGEDFVASAPVSAPGSGYFLRLVRSGTDSFTGYYSPDDVNWTQVGSTVVITAMNTTAQGGLVATSSDDGSLSPAVFSSVSAIPGPTIIQPANAIYNPVNASSTSLSVLATDNLGEGGLSYAWSASGPGTVTYLSANGTNSADGVVATFSESGTYTFTVTVTDPVGLSATSNVTVVVNTPEDILTPGYIDQANMDEISGWAYDPNNPTASVNVQVVITGGPTQTFLANENRSDLVPVIGSANHGFTYATPMLSAGEHVAYIYVIESNGNKILLNTEPLNSQNSLFDEHYYLTEYPNVAAAVQKGEFATGYDHYIEYGQYEGYNPSPFWNEAWYLKENPDVAAAVAAGTVSSGFMQYYLYGQYENRGGLLYFNTQYYLQNNADVAAAIDDGSITSAYEHFVLWGQYEGRSPMLYFNSAIYDDDNQDILPYITGEPFTSDYEQFIEYGQYEGRIASDFYDNAIYLSLNPDVAAAVADGQYPDAFQQWLEYGQYEGRTAV